MKTSFLQGAIALGALALIPATTAALADGEASSYKALDEFMDVFQKVRTDYVEKVDDEKLIKGAIDGMLASLDPHSSFLDARDFQNLRTQTEGSYGGLGLSVTQEDGAFAIGGQDKAASLIPIGFARADDLFEITAKLCVFYPHCQVSRIARKFQ